MQPAPEAAPSLSPRKRKFMFFPMTSVIAHSSHALETAKVLRARGHDVVFAGRLADQGRSRMHMIEDNGFRVVHAEEPNFEYIWDAILKWGFAGMYIEFSRPRKWADFDAIMESQIRAIKDEQPDAVIGCGALTMSNSAYVAGVPALNIHNAYMVDFVLRYPYFRYWWRWYDWNFLAPQRNKVYKRHGVKLLRAIDLYRAAPLLSPDIPGLYDTCAYFHNAIQVGPILFDFPAPLPEWFGELDDGTPNVYITMGSTGSFDTFLKRSYRALSALPYRFIVTTAGQVSDETLRSAPKNFRFTKYAPGAELLRHCSAMIFHGGNGSMYQALAAGVPMLAIPTHVEQILNSRIAARAGFCKWIFKQRAATAGFARIVRDIVENDRYREAAHKYADQVRTINGAVNAANECERIAESSADAPASST